MDFIEKKEQKLTELDRKIIKTILNKLSEFNIEVEFDDISNELKIWDKDNNFYILYTNYDYLSSFDELLKSTIEKKIVDCNSRIILLNNILNKLQ